MATSPLPNASPSQSSSAAPVHDTADATAALAASIAEIAARYEADSNVPALHERLASAMDAAAAEWPTDSVLRAQVAAAALGRPEPRTLADALVAAARPFEQVPEIAGPLYERIVRIRPDDARALVVLGNAYWLHGRGPDLVGDLAARAIAADPASRGAWHLWALTEADPRQRMLRWQQVTVRFPADDLARALFADAAASVAGAEHDDEALVLAVSAYEELLARAERPEQRAALEHALETLRKWKL